MLRQKFLPSPANIKRKVNAITTRHSPLKCNIVEPLQSFSSIINKIKELVYKLNNIADSNDRAYRICQKGTYVVRHFYMYTQDSLVLFTELLEKECSDIIRHTTKDPLRLFKSVKPTLFAKQALPKSPPKIRKIIPTIKVDKTDISKASIEDLISKKIISRSACKTKIPLINKTIDASYKPPITKKSRESINKSNCIITRDLSKKLLSKCQIPQIESNEDSKTSRSMMKNVAVETKIRITGGWAYIDEDEEQQMDEFISYTSRVANYRRK